MRIRLAIPDKHVSADMLNKALEVVTLANDAMGIAGERPSTEDLLREGCKWAPEKYTDGEHFDLATTIAERREGDCDDWAPTLASDMRLAGDQGARAVVERSRSHPNRWHAVVYDGSGQRHDPSLWAGMPGPKSPGVVGAIHRPMTSPGERGLVCMPYRGRWHCRVDVPWGRDHLSSIAGSFNVGEAVEEALYGAQIVGAFVAADDELAVVGEVGNIFSDAINSAVNMAKGMVPGASAIQQAVPLAQGVLSAFSGAPPGHPAPGMTTAPGGGGSGAVSYPLPGGGSLTCNPSMPMPIIVRF